MLRKTLRRNSLSQLYGTLTAKMNDTATLPLPAMPLKSECKDYQEETQYNDYGKDYEFKHGFVSVKSENY